MNPPRRPSDCHCGCFGECSSSAGARNLPVLPGQQTFHPPLFPPDPDPSAQPPVQFLSYSGRSSTIRDNHPLWPTTRSPVNGAAPVGSSHNVASRTSLSATQRTREPLWLPTRPVNGAAPVGRSPNLNAAAQTPVPARQRPNDVFETCFPRLNDRVAPTARSSNAAPQTSVPTSHQASDPLMERLEPSSVRPRAGVSGTNAPSTPTHPPGQTQNDPRPPAVARAERGTDLMMQWLNSHSQFAARRHAATEQARQRQAAAEEEARRQELMETARRQQAASQPPRNGSLLDYRTELTRDAQRRQQQQIARAQQQPTPQHLQQFSSSQHPRQGTPEPSHSDLMYRIFHLESHIQAIEQGQSIPQDVYEGWLQWALSFREANVYGVVVNPGWYTTMLPAPRRDRFVLGHLRNALLALRRQVEGVRLRSAQDRASHREDEEKQEGQDVGTAGADDGGKDGGQGEDVEQSGDTDMDGTTSEVAEITRGCKGLKLEESNGKDKASE